MIIERRITQAADETGFENPHGFIDHREFEPLILRCIIKNTSYWGIAKLERHCLLVAVFGRSSRSTPSSHKNL